MRICNSKDDYMRIDDTLFELHGQAYRVFLLAKGCLDGRWRDPNNVTLEDLKSLASIFADVNQIYSSTLMAVGSKGELQI